MIHNSGINKVFLVGLIEREPRWHKSFQKQDELCFTLSTKEHIKKNDTNIEHTELHYVKITANHPDLNDLELKKGQLVHVMGKIQTKSWTDELQVKRYKAEIIVTQLQIVTQPSAVEAA